MDREGRTYVTLLVASSLVRMPGTCVTALAQYVSDTHVLVA
jgi:hypothetical protein